MGDVTEQPMEAGGGEEVIPDLAQLVELALEIQTAKVKQLEAAKKQQQSASTSAAGSGGSGGGLPQVHKYYFQAQEVQTRTRPHHSTGLDLQGAAVSVSALGSGAPACGYCCWFSGRIGFAVVATEGALASPSPNFAHLADLPYVQFICVPFQGWVKFGGKPTWPPECLALAAAIRRRPAPGLLPRPGLREHQQAKPGTRKPGAAAASVTGSASGSPHKARARQ